MAAALKFKPKCEQLRVIYSGEPGGVDSVTKNPGKVFCVIGPFHDFTDKQPLMDAIEMLVRGHHLTER